MASATVLDQELAQEICSNLSQALDLATDLSIALASPTTRYLAPELAQRLSEVLFGIFSSTEVISDTLRPTTPHR
jgi:hypothetical protein